MLISSSIICTFPHLQQMLLMPSVLRWRSCTFPHLQQMLLMLSVLRWRSSFTSCWKTSWWHSYHLEIELGQHSADGAGGGQDKVQESHGHEVHWMWCNLLQSSVGSYINSVWCCRCVCERLSGMCFIQCRGPHGGKQLALALFAKVGSTDCLM
jgi:hypothetical protein